MRTSRLLVGPPGRLLFSRLAGFYKKSIKKSSVVDYLEIPNVDSNGKKFISEDDIQTKFEVKRTMKGKPAPAELYTVGENGPVPCVASLGPITINNPEIFTKKYKWCSCGLSSKQVSQNNQAILRSKSQRHRFSASAHLYTRPCDGSPLLRMQAIYQGSLLRWRDL